MYERIAKIQKKTIREPYGDLKTCPISAVSTITVPLTIYLLKIYKVCLKIWQFNHFEDHPRTTAWINLIKNKDSNYHRVEILYQGRANFSERHEGLSPKDKVDLYCVHYMPMHLFSSYYIFTQYLTSVSNRVVFIDFGCGPLTSGIAFWASARRKNITYLGIDSSRAMLNKAKEINRYGPNKNREPFFRNFQAIDDYHKLISLLDYYIKKGDGTQIIFNFCYFLASRTLDISDLSECLTQIVEKYHQHKIVMLQTKKEFSLV